MSFEAHLFIYLGVTLSFRTYQENVLLFFAASPGIQEEIIVVQLRGGRPWFIFDTQGSHDK